MGQAARRYLLFALLLAAFGSWWLASREVNDTSARLDHNGDRPVDYTISRFDVVRMRPDGQPRHQLKSVYLERFADDGSSALQQPFLTVFGEDAPPWQINSERGHISPDGNQVELLGAVLIERDGDAENRAMRIETRNLRVRPDEDYAETDEQVTVKSGSDWIDAVGMQAWFGPPSRIKFLSQVKGRYVPL
jgi:lipopolysaccharide export system protein LptC